MREHPDRQRHRLRHRLGPDALIGRSPEQARRQGFTTWTRSARCRPAPPHPRGRRRRPTSPTCSGAPARGDEAAFAQLYDATSRRVFGLALRVVRDPAQAEEVAQEAFLEIWRTSGRFDPDTGSALAWMLTIVHRKAVDRVRSAEASTRRDTTYHQQNQPIDARLDRRGRPGLAGGTPGPRRAGRPHRGPARGHRARVLRGLHTHGGGDHARPTGRHRQDPHPGRTDPAARHHGGGPMSDIHALSGAYAVDALDDIERAQFERHLAECAECRAEVDEPARGRRPARRDHRRRRRPPGSATGCSPTSPPSARCRRSPHPSPHRSPSRGVDFARSRWWPPQPRSSPCGAGAVVWQQPGPTRRRRAPAQCGRPDPASAPDARSTSLDCPAAPRRPSPHSDSSSTRPSS